MPLDLMGGEVLDEDCGETRLEETAGKEESSTAKDLEKAMLDPKDKNYEKYLKIRKRNLHKMNLIPICKFDNNE